MGVAHVSQPRPSSMPIILSRSGSSMTKAQIVSIVLDLSLLQLPPTLQLRRSSFSLSESIVQAPRAVRALNRASAMTF